LKSFMKILVAYDGSALAEKALGQAIDIAEKFNGSIIVVHVAWEQPDDESRRVLHRAEEKLKRTGLKYELRSERSQYPPRRIVRIAMDEACDLIAIGSRGFSMDKAWLIGSVSSKVIEDSPCPVLVVK